MFEKDCSKLIVILIAEKPGEPAQCVRFRGQRMGLLVRLHLQTVLDATKKRVGRSTPVARCPVNPAPRRQCRQRLHSLAAPKFRMPASGDQLLSLREELDFANPATAELDV